MQHLTHPTVLQVKSIFLCFRYPSGNNNTSINVAVRHHAAHCFVRKSSSLPNLQMQQQHNNQLHVSQAISTSTVDSYGRNRRLLPMYPMPVSTTSESESPAPLQNSNSSNGPPPSQPSFNLVKLFIKQKSSSTDTCMDVSSGCWPSDSSSSIEQRQRKKSMNDSGKGSALSRHDEDNENDFQYDSLDVAVNSENVGKKAGSNDLYREVFDSPSHRNYKECNLNIRNYPKHMVSLNNNNNSMEKDSLKETNKSLSDASRTSDNITQVFAKVPVDVITRSIQTSIMLKDRVKIVPPSFLAQLNENNKLGEHGEHQQAPVYVIYPNYALPNLDFVKTNQSEIILSPLGYKDTTQKHKRPVSLVDFDELKKKEYKHVIDWQSLAPLLPVEYRQMLKHIPDVDTDMESILSQRPMFCMSPPLRRTRPLTCDCSSYYNTSTSSGSDKPPSSGFRGSSTMLTDSELDIGIANNNDPMRNMYVYQYEDGQTNVVATERPPSGRLNPPPRGILRRSSTKTKTKRNSMFEETQLTGTNNFDKRRSLQEPPYPTNDTHHIIEDYLAELNDEGYDGMLPNRLNNSRVYATRQQNKFYDPHQDENSLKANKTNLNYKTESNEETASRRILLQQQQQQQQFDRRDCDVDARSRAEHFLSNVPKSELKYYAEIANILESIENNAETYDRIKLRNEVSRALSQKKVSFNGDGDDDVVITTGIPNIMLSPNLHHHININNNNNNNINNNPSLLAAIGNKEFTTPPNSPNISIATLRNSEQRLKRSEEEKQAKIQNNRFKRLQIQWELLSKEAHVLEQELIKETRSGGSTPTSATGAPKSRIPRPVSYPASK